jgi:hypothetical protein
MMSRSGDQYLFEIAAAAKYFAAWVCDDQNRSILAATINLAAAEYEKQRTARVNVCGVPVADVSPTTFTSSAATTTITTTPHRRRECITSSPPFAVDPEDEERESLLSSVPEVAEKVSQAVCSAASTALYWGRFLCAKAIDSALSNSVEKFRKMFPGVDATNAQIAFLYIGELSNGWAVEHHNGIGRASLSTLILTAVLDVFVKVSTARKGALSDLTKDTIVTLDTSSDFVSVDWEAVPAEEGSGKVDDDLPHLARFLTCYAAREGIDPLTRPEQAKQIFLAFAVEAKKLSIPLKKYTDHRLKQLEMAGNDAASPKR